MEKMVYMDNHATTPVDPRVVDAMLPYLKENFGNPASTQHRYGWIAGEAVEKARKSIARTIGASPGDIVFTSGSTEANNLALKGIFEKRGKQGAHIVTVRTEHKSVIDVCKRLEKKGAAVTYLEVDKSGLLDPQAVADALTDRTIIVSVMFANNEIGTIQPMRQIGTLCREKGILFHTDATQAVGKVPVDVDSMKIDLLSMSAHKIYGPKGAGFLYSGGADRSAKPAAQLEGGGHEGGARSGTLNVPGIVGLAHALEIALECMTEEAARLSGWRDEMLRSWQEDPGDVYLNGDAVHRLPNNLNVSFPPVEDGLLMMSMKEIAVSSASACSTLSPGPSYVLKALGLAPERLRCSIRLGLGRFTTAEEVSYVISRVAETVRRLRISKQLPATVRP